MKNTLIVAFSFFISLSLGAFEAYPVKEIAKEIQNTKFQFKERGLVFGFNKTQSCLYVSSEILILKNYCYPVKDYPAKSFTIISKKWGIAEYYVEDREVAIKRDARINAFSDIIRQYFTGEFKKETISSMNYNFKKLDHIITPGCWSTNYSDGEGEPSYGCFAATSEEVTGLGEWIDETQVLVSDESAWKAFFGVLENATK